MRKKNDLQHSHSLAQMAFSIDTLSPYEVSGFAGKTAVINYELRDNRRGPTRVASTKQGTTERSRKL